MPFAYDLSAVAMEGSRKYEFKDIVKAVCVDGSSYKGSVVTNEDFGCNCFEPTNN